MGQRPSFNPNVRDVTNYYNDLVSYSFEPGSTMKISHWRRPSKKAYIMEENNTSLDHIRFLKR
ncbi:penicillin-binding transpeptidase domain-containing protein [Bacillus licheniformis]|nr:penicillin-binding transpeptidase domain-containing protein [Bacillus licheniformis]